MKELRQEGNQKALNQLQNNNNATVTSDRLRQNLNADQPVVASAKSLIDSIKRRKVDADRKAVGSVAPKKLMEFYSEPPEPGTSSQEKSQPIEGDGIQVEVNDSDDSFLDNEHPKDVEHRSSSGSESDDGDVIDEEKNSSSEHEISSGKESEYLEKNYRRPQKSGKHNQKKQKVSSVITHPLGDLDSSDEEMRELESNPKVQRLFRKYLAQRENVNSGRKQVQQIVSSPAHKIKSPSDTTLYVPTLGRVENIDCKQIMAHPVRQRLNIASGATNLVTQGPTCDTIDQISNFVEQIWMQSDQNPSTSRQTLQIQDEPRDKDVSKTNRSPLRHSIADRMLIKAEQFKADVMKPKGISGKFDQFLNNEDFSQFIKILMENDDDEFFHLTCHIYQNLKLKIESGQFIDLEQLLPKS